MTGIHVREGISKEKRGGRGERIIE